MAHSTFCNVLNAIGATITYIRNFVLNAIFLFIIFIIALAIILAIAVSDSDKNKQDVPEENYYSRNIIYVELGNTLEDSPKIANPAQDFLDTINDDVKPYVFYQDLIDSIKLATKDDNITTLVINAQATSYIRLDMVKDIGEQIQKFREKGKKVYIYAHSYSQSVYALATYADFIGLDPFGSVEFTGMSLKTLYYKDLLDNTMISIFVPKAGTHKSAAEPYLRNDMSQHVKDEYMGIIGDLWQQYTEVIKQNRNIDPNNLLLGSAPFLSELKKYFGDMAIMALKNNLVTNVNSYSAFLDFVASQTNTKVITDKNKKTDNLEAIAYSDYLTKNKPSESAKDKVAIIYGIGEIISNGESLTDFSSDNIVPLIRQASDDKNVKALVLYLNTPGGEVIASEDIRRELMRFKTNDRKIVVYMAGMTASGGYWISTAADKIVAQNSTITGSIGVFAITGSIHQLIENYGIHLDGVSNSEASSSTILAKIPEGIKETMQLEIDSTYFKFKNFVSLSRNINITEVDDLAQGKIYTGKQAIKLNLIDSIGNFEDAVMLAAKEAGIEKKFKTQDILPKATNGLNSFSSLFVRAVAEINKPLSEKLINELLPKPVAKAIKKDSKMQVLSITPVNANY